MTVDDVRAKAPPPYAVLRPNRTSSVMVELVCHPESLNRQLVSAENAAEPEVRITSQKRSPYHIGTTADQK